MLDEVTVDLDVVARMDLLDFFKDECEQVCTCFLNIPFTCMHTPNFETLKHLKQRETVDMHKGLDTPVNHVMRNCVIYWQATCRKYGML